MSARLTEIERRERDTLEEHLQAAIVDVAVKLGWEWLHVRPGQMKAAKPGQKARWWTSTVGSLRHWPDLVLIRRSDRRLIFAELKRELEQPTDEQLRVLEVLGALTWPRCMCRAGRGEPLADWQLFGSQEVDGVRHDPGCALVGGAFSGMASRIEVHVWRPSDLRDPIEESVIGRVLA